MAAARAHRLFAARQGSGTLIAVAVAVVALAGTVVQLNRGGPHFGEPGTAERQLDFVGAALAVAATVPLLAWRRAPRAVFVLTAAATVLLAGLGYPVGLPLGSAAALYLFAASRDESHPWTRAYTATVVALFLAYVAATAVGQDDVPWSEASHAALAWAVAWFAGERARLRREQMAELRERAARAEREGERERRLATAEERGRIARDLHDAAGHAINVIAVRAGTARLRQDPVRSQAALEMIEELARKTVAEIDQIVGTLRERTSTGVDDPPGLASLDTLVARHAAAGLDVSVTSDGKPRPLDGAVDQAAYRILQEALTNAARHGSGAARVGLAFGETALELTISNAAQRGHRARANGGHGLIGMRERATLLGGSLEVERANGSFRVCARLPYLVPSA